MRLLSAAAIATFLVVQANAAPLQPNVGAPVSNDVLNDQRGGFVVEGVVIRIGLEQIISIDGHPQVINHLEIPVLGQTRPQLEQWFANTGAALPAELKAGTTVTGQLSEGALLTVIQNHLDGKLIQNAKSLNIELNNLGPIRPAIQPELLHLLGR